MKQMKLITLAIGLMVFSQAAQAGWGPTKRLTWTSGASTQPAIAADSSDNLHLVWVNFTPGNAEIYYKKSMDGGATWSAGKRLTWTPGDSSDPALAVDPSRNPHVVWQENVSGNREIYYKKSIDGGATWSDSKRLTTNSGNSLKPALAVDTSGNPHVVWHDHTPGNAEIYYRKSQDGGASWSESRRLTWNSGHSYVPRVAVDSSGKVHVAWSDWTPGSSEIYYKNSTNGGAIWSSSKRLTWNSGQSYYPQIAAESPDNLHIAWNDEMSGNRETYYKKSTDGAASWSASQRLTWNFGESWNLELVVDSSKDLHLLRVDTTPGSMQVFYKKSTNGGASWSAGERLSWTSSDIYELGMAADPSGNVHVVWEDGELSDLEIYYKKGD
jgi:hypothetical protein